MLSNGQRFRFLFLIFSLFLISSVEGIDKVPMEHQLMLNQNQYVILGIGDACIDLLIHVSEEFLTQIPGEKGGSQPISSEELNQILEKMEETPCIATGGSCANTIKGLAGLNEKCGFFSFVGKDPFGDYFSKNFKKWGILELFVKSSLSNSIVLCLITPDGQRTMRFCPGASVEMSDAFLHSDYFRGIKLIHLDAYTLRRGRLAERAIELAKEGQAKVSIDLSSFEVVREFHERILELLPTIDIVFANENETMELTGLKPHEGCLKLQEMCPIAVVLLGDKGCLVGHEGQILHSPAFLTHVVDSTGAGDLFASGFLYGYMQGYSLDKCAKLGNRLGSAIVEETGAELPIEKLEIIRNEVNFD